MCLVTKSIQIRRSNQRGVWSELAVIIKTIPGCLVFDEFNRSNRNEEQALSNLMDKMCSYLVGIEEIIQFREKIVRGFSYLRVRGMNGNRQRSLIIYGKPKGPHFTCKQNKSKKHTVQAAEKDEHAQSELKVKLVNFDENSKIMKFFVENVCAVCLSNYNEILNEDLHIVIPSCGHPLYCKCADGILSMAKKKCPRCKININSDSFSLVKFNTELEMVTQGQEIFL